MQQNNINKMFKQKRVKFLGEVIESVFTAIPLISAFSYLSTTIILWETIKEYILDLLPWMNLFYFILFLALIFIPIIFLTFKYVIPSVWNFRSSQMSHLEEKLDALTKEVKGLKADENSDSK